MYEQNQNLATGILEIDRNAVAKNYRNIAEYCRKFDENAIVSAVVKANGYGLGMIEVSHALYMAGCRLFYVATPDEAISLRAEFTDIEICVLDGLFIGSEAIYQKHDLIPCLASVPQIQAWAGFGNLSCVLHFNSGINRLGLSLSDFKNIAPHILDKLKIHHIMSHFASADWPDDAQNSAQVNQFELVSTLLPNTDQSFANSAAIALKTLQENGSENAHILRPGIALWGVKPFKNYPIELEPVVKLSVRVLQISHLEKNDMVGYGHFFTADKPMRTAIVAAGYADGLFRQISSADTDGGYFCFKNYNLPILGKVSMDMIVVDASSLPEDMLREGDYVEVIGENISLDMLANWSDTIAYEILTSLGKRFLRNYI